MKRLFRLKNDFLSVNKMWIGVLAAVATLYTLPVYQNIHAWGIQDWDFSFFHYAVPRQALMDFHQLPLWNPYAFGGMPMLGDPESLFCQPLFLVILLFGPVVGAKILITLHIFIGLTGAFCLAGRFSLDMPARYVSAFTYGLSSMGALVLTAGMATFLPFTYLPWCLYCQLRSFDRPRWAVGCGLLLAMMFLAGGTFISIYGGMMVVAVYLVHIDKIGVWRVMKRMLLVVTVASGIAAVKLLPAIAFFSAYPRLTPTAKDGYSIVGFITMLLSRHQALSTIGKQPWRGDGWWTGMNWFMDENGMYIGVLPLALALVGVLVTWRRQWRYAAVGLVFIWLGFGFRCPVSLWAVLHELPVFSAMRIAMRFRVVFLIFIALFAGHGFQWLARRLRENRPAQTASALIVAFVLWIAVDMILVSRPIWKESFTIDPPVLTRAPLQMAAMGSPSPVWGENDGELRQINQLPLYTHDGYARLLAGKMTIQDLYAEIFPPYQQPFDTCLHGTLSSLYPAFLLNLGTLEAYVSSVGNIPKNVATVTDRNYRGELYLIDTKGTATFASKSPNRMVIDVDAEQAGRVVVNQNGYPGWRLSAGSSGRLVQWRGLLAVSTQPGRHQYELRYLPTSVIVGGTITALSILAVLTSLVLLRHRDGPKMTGSDKNSFL